MNRHLNRAGLQRDGRHRAGLDRKGLHREGFGRGALRRSLLLLALLLFGVVAAQNAGNLDSRVFNIADQLRCPVCVSESVAESSSPTSIQMREIIQEQLQEGRSEAEILAFFQDRYGDWILLQPPMRGLHLLVWILPPIAAIAGLVALVLFFRRWTKKGQEPVEVGDEDLARVREALADGNQ